MAYNLDPWGHGINPGGIPAMPPRLYPPWPPQNKHRGMPSPNFVPFAVNPPINPTGFNRPQSPWDPPRGGYRDNETWMSDPHAPRWAPPRDMGFYRGQHQPIQ